MQFVFHCILWVMIQQNSFQRFDSLSKVDNYAKLIRKVLHIIIVHRKERHSMIADCSKKNWIIAQQL